MLRRSYDRIVDGHGLTLLTDNVHLDERAAAIVADLVEDFVMGEDRVHVRDVEVPVSGGSIGARLYESAPPTTHGLVWMHGGGFVGGSIDMAEGDAVAWAIAASGMTVLSVDYRRVPPLPRRARWRGAPAIRFPTPVDDCVAAWGWLARELGPTTPVTVGGASAGGNLATLAVLGAREAGVPPATSVILVYPLLHPSLPATAGLRRRLTNPWVRWMGRCFVGPGDVVDGFPKPSQLDGFPPTTIVVAERDGLRPSGEAFAADLRTHGVEVEVVVEPGTGHGYLNVPDRPPFGRTIERLVRQTR